MLLAVDVQYRDDCGFAAGVLFQDWHSDSAVRTVSARLQGIGEYVPGEFYKRELPCILQLLRGVDEHVDAIIIDGFVYLDGDSRPGLGKYLFDALEGRYPIVGVAKTSFADISDRFGVLRGDSKRPLYVTTAGCGLDDAKRNVAAMHGKHRIPTLLKLVDQCCRGDALTANEHESHLMSNTEHFDGGCLCGAIRYRATSQPLRSVICHCEMCRRHSGSPALAFVHFAKASFTWLLAEPAWYRSSPFAERAFCPICGSTLGMREEVLADRVQVCVGSLDEPGRINIQDHVWTSSQVHWFDIKDALPRFSGSSSAVPSKAT